MAGGGQHLGEACQLQKLAASLLFQNVITVVITQVISSSLPFGREETQTPSVLIEMIATNKVISSVNESFEILRSTGNKNMTHFVFYLQGKILSSF